MHRGDESYAGALVVVFRSSAVQELTPIPHVLPTHQGRASERILFELLGGPGKVVPNNTHFDTTRANVEFTGAEAVDLVIAEGGDPRRGTRSRGTWTSTRLDTLIAEAAASTVPLVHGHGHEQQRRRPAGHPGEPARRSARLRPLTAFRCSSTRAGSPRTRT